ncbi:uncharacterized protein LOC104582405 [Brachypodium distachyon]|uniref:uncharacterized protein LOC104582405 n=1 Tax=Brachypodium distachyon TaxID=15368 RepID=UPI00052FEE92|nr:uncharacterized protein LOC104582405 [Brachypodium distachyon]|eukprot:XP_010230229.1 uncharacterized protein LOC104582405 [Brachypodium distachyon]
MLLIPNVFPLEMIRWELRSGPLRLELALSPETAACVVLLLELDEDDKLILLNNVVAGVETYVHRIMENGQAHVVFNTLLRRCEGRYELLWRIVHAVMNFDYWNYQWVTSLCMLITAVAQHPYPHLCRMIVRCVKRDDVMNGNNADTLLQHCFFKMPYEYSKALIYYAMDNTHNNLRSEFWWKCLAKCFTHAKERELHELEEFSIDRATEMAEGKYSCFFLRHVLMQGSTLTNLRLVDELIGVDREDIMRLSGDPYANCILLECFLNTSTDVRDKALYRVLSAFLVLHPHELAQLMQNACANHVLRVVLNRGEAAFPLLSLMLAERILLEPSQAILEHPNVQKSVNFAMEILYVATFFWGWI